MTGFLKWLFTSDSSADIGGLHVKASPFAVCSIVATFIFSLCWVFQDARQRGKSGWLAVFFVVIATWPFSLLFWLWLRPQSPILLKNETPPSIPLD